MIKKSDAIHIVAKKSILDTYPRMFCNFNFDARKKEVRNLVIGAFFIASFAAHLGTKMDT